MKTIYILLLLPGFILFFSCSTGKKGSKNKPAGDSVLVEQKITDNTPLMLNQCRLTATITSIYPARNSSEGDVCDSLPCIADIEIKEVLKTAPGFSVNLNPGNVVSAHFAFTLIPTQNIFPDLQPPLPGLKVGDTFLTSMETRMLPGGGFNFYITDYKKLSSK